MPTTWAVDLANIGPIYPWQGSELILVIAGVAFWILWHIIQLRDEREEFESDVAEYGSKESIKKALDDHSL